MRANKQINILMDTLSLSHTQPYRDLLGQTPRQHVQEKAWPQVCAVSVDTGCGDSCWGKHCKRVHTPTSWPLLMAIDDHGGNIQRPEATWTDLARNSPPPVWEQQTKQKCRWQTRRRHRGCCGEPLGGLWLKPSRPLARQSPPYTADAFTQLKIALLVLSWEDTGLMYCIYLLIDTTPSSCRRGSGCRLASSSPHQRWAWPFV